MPGCPSANELRGLLDGSLSGEDSRRIESHTSSCPTCRDELDRLESAIRSAGGRITQTHDSGPRATLLPAPLVEGYENLSLLKAGGQGVVYKARQTSTKRTVALKLLLEPIPSEEQLERFEREIECVARLRHPNIVTVYECRLTDDDRLYYSMEFVEGHALDAYLRTHEPPIEDRLRLFIKICDAVACAHREGIVHRDLKPGNIRVDPHGEPRVLDFGLARHTVSERTAASANVTRSGEFLGTLAYAAPEQFDGDSSRVTERTDVWALGVLLYEMLTGRPPFTSTGSLAKIEREIREESPPRPSSHRRGLDADLDTIVLRAMAKEPARRYPSAGDLAADVCRFLAGEPIEARRDSATYVVRKHLRKHRIPLVVGSAFLLLVAIVAYFAHRASVSDTEARRALARNQYNDALAMAHHDPTNAISLLDDAIENDPTFLDAKLRRALLYSRYRGVNEAIAAAKSILNEHADQIEAHILLAKFYERVDPAQSEYHRSRGSLGSPRWELYAALLEQDDHTAVQLLTTLIDGEGAEFDALTERALRRERLRDFAGMLEDATDMLTLKPRSSLALTAKGTALENLGRFSEALDCYDEALRHNSHSAYIYVHKADALCNLNRYAEAVDACTLALERRSNLATAYVVRAWARWHQHKQHNAVAAIADCTTAITISPHIARAYFCRAAILASRGEKSKAIRELTIAIERDPHYAEAFYERALLYIDAGRLDLALMDADKTIALRPLHAEFYDLRAQVLEHQGEHQRAIDDFGTAIRLDPSFPRAYYNRGRLWRLMGDYEAALMDLDEVAECAPNSPMPFIGRAITFRLLGDDERAIADLHLAISRAQASLRPLLYLQLWEIHALNGNSSGAAESVFAALEAPDARPSHATIVLYIAGETPEEEFLRVALTDKSRSCETYYFLGVKCLTEGKSDDAQAWFEKCIETKQIAYDELELARMHLGRLRPS